MKSGMALKPAGSETTGSHISSDKLMSQSKAKVATWPAEYLIAKICTAVVFLAILMLTLSLVGQAQALTLINRDETEYRMLITEQGGESATQEMLVYINDIIDGLCPEGCVISLDSGKRRRFEGHESVYIENGRFVVAK